MHEKSGSERELWDVRQPASPLGFRAHFPGISHPAEAPGLGAAERSRGPGPFALASGFLFPKN